ncbi:hypothetical protein PMG71_00550 [Roseofilum sp. BLCC_M154]|uniref:Uncharacterized protein n=1 Tax=Roseofilum acuticapitatum BLCC-M154 TaxID=3022444 RepID=A0ABT7ALZ1_9CYAN|nr:hypothetical protein [Roseofilum acuticapitatum]MDJ1167910.1 hypothetical protein [Roseofilum acuticapitatum BLCC-M154]
MNIILNIIFGIFLGTVLFIGKETGNGLCLLSFFFLFGVYLFWAASQILQELLNLLSVLGA